jgi:hypothetical protein
MKSRKEMKEGSGRGMEEGESLLSPLSCYSVQVPILGDGANHIEGRSSLLE